MAKTNKTPVQADELIGDLDQIITEDDKLRAQGLRRAQGAEKMMGLGVMPIAGDPKGEAWWLEQARKTHEKNKQLMLDAMGKSVAKPEDAPFKKQLKGSTAGVNFTDEKGNIYRRVIKV
jgi:hypothetical protein